ncbi:MAG: hypothetical protein JWN15_426 [Firmicutes bacterium]|nr:hypothetical protein [Bacillota bacterium]
MPEVGHRIRPDETQSIALHKNNSVFSGFLLPPALDNGANLSFYIDNRNGLDEAVGPSAQR